jgi:hypothetical protein
MALMPWNKMGLCNALSGIALFQFVAMQACFFGEKVSWFADLASLS